MYMYVCICISLSLSLSTYIYIYHVYNKTPILNSWRAVSGRTAVRRGAD